AGEGAALAVGLRPDLAHSARESLAVVQSRRGVDQAGPALPIRLALPPYERLDPQQQVLRGGRRVDAVPRAGAQAVEPVGAQHWRRADEQDGRRGADAHVVAEQAT